ncbi:MAG: hypothetical protein K6A30_08290 [Lachnospiraceae bacterium]|nr:hypothetical protein [Lachnospiraceae bacterium]
MQVRLPLCLRCQNYHTETPKPGEPHTCDKYREEIPGQIYWQAGNCEKFEAKCRRN